jgi:hypothetical protein
MVLTAGRPNSLRHGGKPILGTTGSIKENFLAIRSPVSPEGSGGSFQDAPAANGALSASVCLSRIPSTYEQNKPKKRVTLPDEIVANCSDAQFASPHPS